MYLVYGILFLPSSVRYCKEMLVSRDSDVAPSLSLYDDLSVLIDWVETSIVDWLSVTSGFICKLFLPVTLLFSFSALPFSLLSSSPYSLMAFTIPFFTTVSSTSLKLLLHSSLACSSTDFFKL